MSAVLPTTSVKAAGGNILATASYASGDDAGTIKAMNLQWNPRLTAAAEIIIPTSESWMLVDLYANSAADAGTDVNPQIELRKDNDICRAPAGALQISIRKTGVRPHDSFFRN